jgi:hypothetical protein
VLAAAPLARSVGAPTSGVLDTVSERRAMDSDFRRSVRRVLIPEISPGSSIADDGQFEWVWAVPLPYRVLVDPRGASAMPASPRDALTADRYGNIRGALAQGLGYFACLQSFLTYSFGWTRHDQGIRAWHEAGRPTEDPRLALIDAVWGDDRMLLRYAAWSTDAASGRGESWLGEPLHRFMDTPADLTPMAQDGAWEEIVRRERDTAIADDPSTSPWGMHLGLGSHIGAPAAWGGTPNMATDGPATPAWRARLIGADPVRRRATYVSDRVYGWYAGLAALGGGLADAPGASSWRVDVLVKPYGFLGTYRRSRTTGLWFAGRHRHHMMGNEAKR